MKLINGLNKIKMIFECHAKRQRMQRRKETTFAPFVYFFAVLV
jgi:hypothetical protein